MQADSHSRDKNRQLRRLFSSIYIFIHEFFGLSIFLGHICHPVPRALSTLAREMSFLFHKPPVERSAIIYPAEDESAATTCSTECPQEFTQQQRKMSARREHDDKVLLRGFLGYLAATQRNRRRARSQKTTGQIMNHAFLQDRSPSDSDRET